MRRIRPEVVITFGVDGLYWHPDHIAVCERTTAAVRALEPASPALYYVTMPPGAVRTMVDEYVRTLKETPATLPAVLGVSNPDAFGAVCEPPTLVIDCGAAAVKKLAALRCHRTQMDGGVFAQIADCDAPRLLGIEHFHRAPAGATGETFIDQLTL
jgi:LmbE family N-acetylglucosaminyl deacetylase